MPDAVLVDEIHQVQQPGDDARFAAITVTADVPVPVPVSLGADIAQLIREALRGG
jgi:hypothetical protein